MNSPDRQEANRQLAGEASRYMAATILSACVSLALPIVLHEFIGIAEEIAVAIALIMVFLMNFMVIRMFVFNSKAEPWPEFRRFFSVSIGFRVAEYLLFLILFKLLTLNYIISLLISLCISFVTKFFVQRRFVFNGRTD